MSQSAPLQVKVKREPRCGMRLLTRASGEFLSVVEGEAVDGGAGPEHGQLETLIRRQTGTLARAGRHAVPGVCPDGPAPTFRRARTRDAPEPFPRVARGGRAGRSYQGQALGFFRQRWQVSRGASARALGARGRLIKGGPCDRLRAG